MKDLSIIIPSRNEIFLAKTVENILENIEANTEIIIVSDGSWPDPPIKNHDRVQVVFEPVAIGQRASTNLGARVSQAKFVMKADAHCAFGKGFDRVLMEDCKPDWTMIPMMYRLHAFDWKCNACGDQTYQGVLPEKCKACGKSEGFEMAVIWKPREGKAPSVSWRFNHELQFKYWRKHYKRPEVVAQGDLIETMSFIGACMLMERERFWELDGMDEAHGSWGQFGTEISLKSWLSGGKLITSKKTWFGHMFRTGNFRGSFVGGTFPYPLPSKDVDYARKYSRDLWMNNKWPKANYPLSWLIDKFKPVPDWHEGAK